MKSSGSCSATNRNTSSKRRRRETTIRFSTLPGRKTVLLCQSSLVKVSQASSIKTNSGGRLYDLASDLHSQNPAHKTCHSRRSEESPRITPGDRLWDSSLPESCLLLPKLTQISHLHESHCLIDKENFISTICPIPNKNYEISISFNIQDRSLHSRA